MLETLKTSVSVQTNIQQLTSSSCRVLQANFHRTSLLVVDGAMITVKLEGRKPFSWIDLQPLMLRKRFTDGGGGGAVTPLFSTLTHISICNRAVDKHTTSSFNRLSSRTVNRVKLQNLHIWAQKEQLILNTPARTNKLTASHNIQKDLLIDWLINQRMLAALKGTSSSLTCLCCGLRRVWPLRVSKVK